MKHECIIEEKRLPDTATPLYAARCRCHETAFHTLLPEELPYSCPYDLTRGPIEGGG